LIDSLADRTARVRRCNYCVWKWHDYHC